MAGENPYYQYFKYSLQQQQQQQQDSNDDDNDVSAMLGGKYFDPTFGDVYSAPSRYFETRGYGLTGPFHAYRGDGFGTFLNRLFQWSQPLLRRLGQRALDSAGNIVSNVASDAMQGENILESVKKHGVAEGKQLIDEVPGVVEGFLSDKSGKAAPAAVSLNSEPEGVRANIKNARRKNTTRRGYLAKKVKKGRGKKQQGSGSISALYPALNFMNK